MHHLLEYVSKKCYNNLQLFIKKESFKLAFDGIVTKTIVNELNENIIGAKINKVFEPTKNDIIIGLYCNGKNYALNICVNPENCRLHLTTYSKPNPQTAPNFCMLLRKHLIGSRIVSINSYDLERTVEFTLETYNELNDKINKKLIVEIMGHFSNVILVNENNNIIDCLRHFEAPRELMPIRPYSPASSDKQSFINISLNDFLKTITPNIALDTQLSGLFIGISKSFIQNLCTHLEINLTSFSQEDLETLFANIKNIVTNLNNNICNVSANGKDYYIVSSKSKENLQANFFIDDFYHAKEEKSTFQNLRNDTLKLVLGELKKYTKRLENINSKLEECKSMDKYKLYGELITSNLYQLGKNEKKANVLNYYTGEHIEIPLDPTISPSKNAEKYFKKYNKLKNTLEIVSKQKKETKLELEYIESLIYSIEEATNLSVLEEINTEIAENFKLHPKSAPNTKNKQTKNTPLQYTINGFTVYVGKNNKQNDTLTKSAHPNDLWFHTQAIHGSHVILKTEGKPVDEDTLYQTATLAAKSSKAKHSSNTPVDYCPAKHVKKPSGAKPGMVIYTNYKTIFVK